MQRYTFFDVTLDMSLPDTLQTQWDLLYNRFSSRSEATPTRTIRVAWEPTDTRHGRLHVDAQVRNASVADAMMHLQDVVQNVALPSVQSHLLWHGAAWRIAGRGVMILGESGLGKTTLSLAERLHGGQVFSDEIAAVDPQTAHLHPFPRAMAAHPHSLSLLNVATNFPRMRLDEDKHIVPLSVDCQSAPLCAVCILHWPIDEAEDSCAAIIEARILASDEGWRRALQRLVPDAVLTPHPDGCGWWRCRTPHPIRAADLEQAVRDGCGVLAGYHRGAHRRPTFSNEPVMSRIDTATAVELSLGELINARGLAQTIGPPRLLALIRSVLRDAHCASCAPGTPDLTREAIHRQVRDLI